MGLRLDQSNQRGSKSPGPILTLSAIPLTTREKWRGYGIGYVTKIPSIGISGAAKNANTQRHPLHPSLWYTGSTSGSSAAT